MSKTYYSVLTTYGSQLFASAMANHQAVSIRQMAVGDGNGRAVMPDSARTNLVREVHRANISAVSPDPRNNKQVIFELTIPENVGGFWIREIGIFDAQNRLVAYANCPETFKPRLEEGSGKIQVIRMVLLVSSSNAVTLTVDDSVIWATRGQLTPKTITATSTNSVDETGHTHAIDSASTTQKGIVQLNNTLTSTSQEQALTAAQGKVLNDKITQNEQKTTDLANQKVNKTDVSDAVNSTSQTTVGSSRAVKTAYDKGVEAKNAADNAKNAADAAQRTANAKQSPAATLAGYGITDGVNKAGDTMTGNLTLPKVSLTANKIQFLDDFIYKNNSGNHLHGFHFTEDSGVPDNNSRGNANLYGKKFEATHIGHGAYANQYTSKAPFMVEENGSVPRDAYHPFVKGKVRTNNQWGAAFSFGYTTNQNPHSDGFGKGIIHLAEDNGRNLAWTFEHDGTMTGGDFRAQGKSLSQAVMHNEITYQKIGNFEIRKYPDGAMIQTYRFTPPNERRGGNNKKFSFNWAQAFASNSKPVVSYININKEPIGANTFGCIDLSINLQDDETNNAKVTFWTWEWHFNDYLMAIDFLAIGRWK